MMKVKAEFEGEACVATLTPENEWEQRLLGAVARGGTSLDGTAIYKPDGHYTYGKAACVQVRLVAMTATSVTDAIARRMLAEYDAVLCGDPTATRTDGMRAALEAALATQEGRNG